MCGRFEAKFINNLEDKLNGHLRLIEESVTVQYVTNIELSLFVN